MNWLTNWERLYIYLRKQGIPRTVLRTVCISEQEAMQIGHIIKSMHPRTILEVGTFVGFSSGVIALTKSQESTLVCVDPDLPVGVITAKFDYFEDRNTLSFVRATLKHFEQERHTVLLQGFFSGLSAWAREQITALGGDPDQAPVIGEQVARYAPFDLVFIDGDHRTEMVANDLSLIAPYMAQNGIIVMHDVSHAWGEQVRAGISQFLQTHPDYSLKIDQNLGFLSRDSEKTWLIPQKKRAPSFLNRVRWKAIRLLSSVD